MLDPSELRTLFSYDPASGVVSRSVSRRARRAKAGPITVKPSPDGYTRIKISGSNVMLHRLAWALHYGEWPTHQIDHISGDRSDNRITNLRDVERSANNQNIHKATGNAGLLGVWYDAKRRNYLSHIGITVDGQPKSLNLGRYPTATEAHDAYLKAKAKYHPFATIAA